MVSSFSISGLDSYIEVGDTATLSGLSALTISAWAITNDTGADQVLFSKNTDADWDSKSEYGVQFGSQDIIFVVYDIDNDAYLGRATTGNEITAGQWHHIACTWDGSTTSAGIKIFIDGIQTDDADANSGSGFVTIRDTATPALIGARHNDLSASSKQRFWDGKIANVGIWSRELSLEEIQSIMRKNYSQLKGTEKTSLVSWWALDDTNLTSELLTNHDFSDGTTGYSPNGFAGAGEGFSVSGGQATIIGDNLFSDFISVDTATALSSDNKKYQIVVDVESFTGTAWGLSHNGNVSIFGSRSLTTSGIHTYTFTWTAAYGLSTRLEANGTLVLNSVSIKEIQVEDLAGSNEGSITGATVTNSVYGGNAPILDRAIDVAKESQADAIGDGQPFFSASHPTISAGTQTNLYTGAALSEASIETAVIQIQKTKDDRGILIGAQAVSLHVPVDLTFTAAQVLQSEYSTTTAANGGNGITNVNDINAVRSMGVIPQGYFVNRRFTDTNAYFFKTDIPNGAKMFNRTPLQTKMEPDFDTGNLRFKARERYSFGVSDWRSYVGNEGA